MPAEPAGCVAVPGSLNLSALLPAERMSWRYRVADHSPCTEGVAWVVLTSPLTLSATQIIAGPCSRWAIGFLARLILPG